ncbi:Neutral zinc metallopeptidases, zinc-binding region [Fulvimarina pelagi HTCC2506]|uniref:Neutral zinc metallopeptidases, zinc-binding region n=1 Tax=Fulvimarina pelagi HTCC2506 TaxID=314231 RepID=Q0G3S8_9HYPH|nr:metallopeptidase family protein [Fulvimarina pelagi]EAU41753.1 Neutral zinc metallopeptidases, zinc-binding region [Fulvimarina pelagi HTCC2506]
MPQDALLELDWTRRRSPSLAEFEAMAEAAYRDLPEEFRKLCGDIRFLVAEFPDDDVLDEMGMKSPFDILGLFEGRGIGQFAEPATGEMPNRILIYRRPILDYWADHEERLGDIVRHVVIHEIGHHFGLSDDDMEAIEARAE